MADMNTFIKTKEKSTDVLAPRATCQTGCTVAAAIIKEYADT